jgi:hypothetical protein
VLPGQTAYYVAFADAFMNDSLPGTHIRVSETDRHKNQTMLRKLVSREGAID